MCHRYFQAHQSAKVAERYAAKHMGVVGEEIPAEVFPGHQSVIVLSGTGDFGRYSKHSKQVTDTTSSPSIPPPLSPQPLGEKGERIVTSMYWGFIPAWIKDEDMAGYDKPNNARSETAIRNLMDGRGMYFQAMHSGRCILSSSGWCEWTGEKGSKVAHRLTVRGDEFVSFAGLYTYRAGFPGFSCTMLTTAAQGKAAEFHQRVPVVLLSREDEDRWLDPASDPRSLVDLFVSIPDDRLESEVLDEPPPVRRRKSGQEDLFGLFE